MASRTQTIRVKLISYTKQFRKRLKDSGTALEKFVGKTKLLSVALIAGSAAFSVFAGAVGLVGAAFGTVGAVIPQLQKYFDIGKDAGLSAEQFQVWAISAQRAGVEIGRLGPILRFTDARIRQFRNGQGELASGLKQASQQTQDYFQGMKSLSNDKFLDRIEEFFASSASEADKSTVAVGLWTENAGLMLRAVNSLKSTRATLGQGGLVLSNEEADNIKSASIALQDMRRQTDIIRDQAVAANVDDYIAAQAWLEEMRRKWYSLLSVVGKTAVELAKAVGILDPKDLVSTVDRLGGSYAAYFKSRQSERESQEEDQHAINVLLASTVDSELDRVNAARLVTAAKAETLKVDIELAAALDKQKQTAEFLQKSKDSGAAGIAISGSEIRLKNDTKEVELLRKKQDLYAQVRIHFQGLIADWKELNQAPESVSGETGYYPNLIARSEGALKVREDAIKALKRLKKERGENIISLEVYKQSETELLKILKGTESVYEKMLRSAREQVSQTQAAENALFKLNDEFQAGKIKAGLFVIAQENLNKVLGITTQVLGGQLPAMQRVLNKLDEYRKRINAAAAEAAAARGLLADGEISDTEYKELFAPPEDKTLVPARQNQMGILLEDFKSFSGDLVGAMGDTETDWNKFWLNMIQTMNKRNLARLMDGTFTKMITTLKGKNKEVVNETKDMTKNIQDAAGGSGAGGFGWGALIGGIATLGSAYILSRNMNKASDGAAASVSGGDVEVVVNINNSTQSNVLYGGRTISESGGIKRTVIDIIVEDYSQGGQLREVLG